MTLHGVVRIGHHHDGVLLGDVWKESSIIHFRIHILVLPVAPIWFWFMVNTRVVPAVQGRANHVSQS